MTAVIKYRVSRFVPADHPNNYLGRDVQPGEVFYQAVKPTYGCVDIVSGQAVTLDPNGGYPFFEFPSDALEEVR